MISDLWPVVAIDHKDPEVDQLLAIGGEVEAVDQFSKLRRGVGRSKGDKVELSCASMGYGVALEITIRVVKAMSTVGVSTSYGPKTRQPLTLA